jgi:hypothetical protein
MNTRTGSTLRTFLEYLGRGATPVDGYQIPPTWLESRKAPGIEKKAGVGVEKNDAYWAKVADDSALCQPRRFSYPGNNC